MHSFTLAMDKHADMSVGLYTYKQIERHIVCSTDACNVLIPSSYAVVCMR